MRSQHTFNQLPRSLLDNLGLDTVPSGVVEAVPVIAPAPVVSTAPFPERSVDPGRHCGPQHGGYIPFTRLFSRILLASSLLALSPLSVLAQSSPPTVSPANDTGVNPYETYEGNRENINLSSGNVNVTIPLVSFPGRNGLDYPVALHYDSKSVWQLGYFVDPNTGIVTYNWLLSSGWSDLTAWITPSLFSASPTVNCNGFLLHMPDGSNHAFPGVRAQCVYANSGQPAYGYNQPIGDSSDGLSTRIDATTYTNLIVYLANGTKFYFNGASLTKIEDRNGNIISFTYPSSGTTVISDTLGRKVTITSVSSTASTIRAPVFPPVQQLCRVVTNYLPDRRLRKI